jgi:hypothetical protein
MEKIIAKISPLSVKALKELAVKLNGDLSTEASIVLDAIMDTLMNRMPEDEFVSFCDTL